MLRAVLRVKPINHTVKRIGRLLMSPDAFARFDRKMPLVDPFEITLPNNQRIQFEPFGDICSKFLNFDGWNGYETGSVELFYALAQHADVTFDVGAYLGYFGLLAAAAHPGARAYSFEAVPQLGRLARRIAKANPHLNIEVIDAAVSDRNGSITLYLAADPFSSDTSTAAGHRPDRTPVTVPAITLDDFVKQRQIERVDLLKIDTETTEPAVLAGFSETIARCRPTFLCEVLPTADVSLLSEFCRKHDYSFAWIRDRSLMAVQAITADTTLCNLNYLFYPRNVNTPMTDEIHRRLEC